MSRVGVSRAGVSRAGVSRVGVSSVGVSSAGVSRVGAKHTALPSITHASALVTILTYFPTYPPISLPTYQPTYLPTYPPTSHLPSAAHKAPVQQLPSGVINHALTAPPVITFPAHLIIYG